MRLCKKVGDQAKEEVILDTAAAKPDEANSAEKIDEEIQKIINKPNLDAIPKVSCPRRRVGRTRLSLVCDLVPCLQETLDRY